MLLFAVLGLDIITTESLYGYEPQQLFATDSQTLNQFTTERIILPDTSAFLKSVIVDGNYFTETNPPNRATITNMIAFPKYNNYMQDHQKFDPFTKFLIPLDLLGINTPESGEITFKHVMSDSRAVVSYAQYREIGDLFPTRYDESVIRRWGIDIMLGSPILSISILRPEFEPKIKPPEVFPDIPKKPMHDINVKAHENDANYLRDEPAREEETRFERSLNEKVKNYVSLMGGPLEQPIQLQMWLKLNDTEFLERSNPQCVQWSTARGIGEWSRVGCITELTETWIEGDFNGPIMINCTCNVLSTFAVLVDVLDLEVTEQ